MSNFVKKLLSLKSSYKELSRKEIEEQRTACSNTNESTQIAKIENYFLNWGTPKLD